VAYIIAKDVHLSLPSFTGTARDVTGKVRCPPPSPILSRHRWTDVILMNGALGGWSGSGLMHTQRLTVGTGVLSGCATVPAHQLLQDSLSMPAPPALQLPIQSSSHGSTINRAPGMAPARHQHRRC